MKLQSKILCTCHVSVPVAVVNPCHARPLFNLRVAARCNGTIRTGSTKFSQYMRSNPRPWVDQSISDARRPPTPLSLLEWSWSVVLPKNYYMCGDDMKVGLRSSSISKIGSYLILREVGGDRGCGGDISE